MAEDSEGELLLDAGQAGLQFKFEMAATNFILGYWKIVLGVIVTGLVGILFYGEYEKQYQKTQRGHASEISDILSELPVDLQQLPLRMKLDEELISVEELTGVGESLVALGQSTSGAARNEALLKAAEVFRIAGATNQQRLALEEAGANAQGPLQYAVVSPLANLDLEQGDGEAAVTRLKGLVGHEDGFLARKATEDLGLALEFLDRDAEAFEVYETFLVKWPDATETEKIRTRQGRLETGG